MKSKDCVGSVLIVGGGVSGIKASLDLAEAGFFVYLLEQTPAIGGVMSQLDKTFPTNDCSMCILSPYLVEVGRHQNIDMITYADLQSVEGRPGKFKVKIKKKARGVHVDRCTGCRACIEACPVTQKTALGNG